MSHQRVKGGKTNLEQYAIFKGKPRSLLVYDESLFASKPEVLNTFDRQKDLAWLTPDLKRGCGVAKQRAIYYLTAVLDAIMAELDRQRRTQTRAQPVVVEPLELADIVSFKASLGDHDTPSGCAGLTRPQLSERCGSHLATTTSRRSSHNRTNHQTTSQ